MTEYWVNSSVWSGIGLLFGYLVGSGVRLRIYHVRLSRTDMDRMIGAILILIAFISTAQSLVFQRHQRDVTTCQARINIKVQETIAARGKIADGDRANISRLIREVSSIKPGDRAAGRKALTRYIVEDRRLGDERRKLPFPSTRQCR